MWHVHGDLASNGIEIWRSTFNHKTQHRGLQPTKILFWSECSGLVSFCCLNSFWCLFGHGWVPSYLKDAETSNIELRLKPPTRVAVLEWTFFLPLATNSWTSKITNLLGQESSTHNKLSWNVCRCASICLFCGHLRSKVCGFLGPCWVCRRCTFEFEQYPYLGDLQPVKKAVPWRIVHFVARWCYPQRLSMFVMVYRPGWS